MTNNDEIKLDEANRVAKDYSCPNCGAPIKYSPEKGVLFCEYCNTSVEINKIESNEELSFSKGKIDDTSWNKETKVVHCDNCGANNVYDFSEISITCPFCGSNQVVETTELTGVKPNRVIPFKQSNKIIDSNYRNWLKKRFFVPGKIKKQIPNLKLRGVYLPVWTFDAFTVSQYNGKLGKRYTRTVGTGKNRRTVTEIRYFMVDGIKKLQFDDIIINAGSKINQEEINKIAPFDTNSSFEYERGFLAGFSSEHYVVRLNSGWENAKIRMNGVIRSSILKDYNHDVVSYLNVDTTFNNIKYKYVLIPVWIGIYTYAKKEYRFLANGETGKVTGKTPISALRVSLTVIVGLIILILLLYWILSLEY